MCIVNVGWLPLAAVFAYLVGSGGTSVTASVVSSLVGISVSMLCKMSTSLVVSGPSSVANPAIATVSPESRSASVHSAPVIIGVPILSVGRGRVPVVSFRVLWSAVPTCAGVSCITPVCRAS